MSYLSASTGSLGVMPGDANYYSPYPGYSRKQLSKDCVTCPSTKEGLVHDMKMQPALTNPESGGYVPYDVLSTGASGSRDYDRAIKEAYLARNNPTLLAQNVSKDLDVVWHAPVTPTKPEAVQFAGMDIFGATMPSSSTRHMVTDFRGEAVERYAVGEPPIGASISEGMGTTPSEKEFLERHGIPQEMQRCNGSSCGVGPTHGHAYKQNLLTKQLSGWEHGFYALC